MAAKATPPVTISLATLAGYNVSELLVWATLIYTLLLIGHKLYSICMDVLHPPHITDRRVGEPDPRHMPVERRGRE